MTKITKTDLTNALADDRQIGWGYAGERDSWMNREDSERASKRQITAIDSAVVSLANKFGWDYEMLFHFTNSKFGRWFADTTFGFSVKDTATAIRKGQPLANDFTAYYDDNPAEFDVECTEI